MPVRVPLLPGVFVELDLRQIVRLLLRFALPLGLGWAARDLVAQGQGQDGKGPGLGWARDLVARRLQNKVKEEKARRPRQRQACDDGSPKSVASRNRLASELLPTLHPQGSRTPTQAPGTRCRVEYPHCVGAFVDGKGPAKGVWHQGTMRSWEFATDVSVGNLHFIHRRSDDHAVDRSGSYPYSQVFETKRCFWECRAQFSFTKIPEGKFYFGIMLDEYVPMNGATKYAMSLVVKALRLIAGDIYHSVGDDPAVVQGEQEKPLFVMPMWAFDQVIITPPGEEAPDVTAPDLSHLGVCRASNRTEFMRLMTSFQPQLGYTYTCNVWAISKLLDLVMWRISGGLPFPISMDNFAGRAPVHVILYALKEEEGGETRHLQSRMQPFLHTAVWSTLAEPPAWRLRELVEEGAEQTAVAQGLPKDSPAAAAHLRARQPAPGCCACFGGLCGR